MHDSHVHSGHEPNHDHEHALDWREVLRIALVATAAVGVWFRIWEPIPSASVIGIVGLLIGGWPMLREAAENLAARRMTMELSMSIAVVAAAAISQFFTALVITLFVLVAEVLENMTVSRGRGAIRELLDILPSSVSVRRNGQICEVPADTLAVGDSILVNPGGKIPADGTVITGHSFVDQTRITGESLPMEKMAGDPVFAGSINQSGVLEIHTEHLGRDTSYGKIIEAVEQAERSRAPVQRLADRLAGYLVYFALSSAILTYLLTRDIQATISVIIVAGACGVAAGTPLAILGAIGRAARAGAIIKGGLYLEQLGRVDTVVLDKTGTLTFGEPEVCALDCATGIQNDELLTTAAVAELRSEHPLGKAVVAHARTSGITPHEPERFAYKPGRGIEALDHGSKILVGSEALMGEHGIAVPQTMRTSYPETSQLFVARDGRVLGVIAIADRVRPEARQALEAIRSMGIRTILLTGDTAAVAGTIAAQLGIGEVTGDLLPEQKRQRVRDLVEHKAVVAMVGDGINDAPALVEADVGIAMGSGTDVARESADAVLLGNNLLKLAETLEIARRARRIIWTNFAGTIAVDTVGILLAGFGFLSPLEAAFVHVASELTFILNSARLLSGSARDMKLIENRPKAVGPVPTAGKLAE